MALKSAACRTSDGIAATVNKIGENGSPISAHSKTYMCVLAGSTALRGTLRATADGDAL